MHLQQQVIHNIQKPRSEQSIRPHIQRTSAGVKSTDGSCGKRKWNCTEPAGRESRGKLWPYKQNLTPSQSALCPHYLAWDHLLLCKPAKARGMGHGIWLQWMSVAGPNQCNEDPECSLACVAWKPVETYRSGLLLYHVFCNHENLPEEQHALAAPVTIAAFVSLLAGCYSGKTLSNYFYRVWAWHNIKFCIQHIVPAFSCSWLWYGICLPMIWPLQWWLQLVRTFHTTAILSNQIQIV